MTEHVIADNWTLQNVAELLNSGISEADASVIRIAGGAHEYVDVLEGGVQTESLFDLLTDIVLRDQIIVDAAYADTWVGENECLGQLTKNGLLRQLSFLSNEEKFADVRDLIADRLCVTDSLKVDHSANVDSWTTRRENANPYLAAVLWGGAGMVARSWVFDSAYRPHPLRRRLFEAAKLFDGRADALGRLEEVVDESRLRLAKRTSSAALIYSMNVMLPPIPIRIIEDSTNPGDFVKVALQLRPEFKPLRDWLRKTEKLLESDDLSAIQKHYGVLSDVSANIDRILGKSTGAATFSIGLGVLKLSAKGDPLLSIKNRIGVRSVINNMILKESGQRALTKYCKMFDVPKTVTEILLTEHFGNT
ncbi:MAG: hypothetical protein AAFX56_00560 [Pseudomonadota bacterium]